MKLLVLEQALLGRLSADRRVHGADQPNDFAPLGESVGAGSLVTWKRIKIRIKLRINIRIKD
jgi:hypothetical protein